MLNMADEQIYLSNNKLDKVDLRFLKDDDDSKKDKMYVKALRK